LASAALALALAACSSLNPKEVEASFQVGVRAYDAGDYAAAYAAWLPLAKAGDLAAQRNIGHLYETGKGIAADPKEAASWYRKAAEAGLGRAQANLANLYLKGQGVPHDDREAAQWFHRAAVNGHVVSQYNLGVLYETGRGVERDTARALGWLHLAAKAGHPQAQEALDKVLATQPPQAVPESLRSEPRLARPSTAKAEPPPAPTVAPGPAAPAPPPAEPASGGMTGFFRGLLGLNRSEPAPRPEQPKPLPPPAAEPAIVVEPPGQVGVDEPLPFAGVAVAPPPAQPPLRGSAGGPVAAGLAAYHDGRFEHARELWEPLARRGDPLAQFYLGGLYRVGAGVSPDPVSAYLWWSLAARGGHQAAKEQLHDLTAEMSVNELVEAERQLRAWRPGS
jgi:uncharacterized protein